MVLHLIHFLKFIFKSNSDFIMDAPSKHRLGKYAHTHVH